MDTGNSAQRGEDATDLWRAIREGLHIAPRAATAEIKRFLRREVSRLGKAGVLVGLSGGLDSSVCAYLCVAALGEKRVRALSLPERDSDPQNVRDAEQVARALGLRLQRIDVTPILKEIGVYELASAEQAADRERIEGLLGWITRLAGQPSAFSEALPLLYNTSPNPLLKVAHRLLRRPIGKVHAFAIAKVRLRMLMLYHHAMLEDRLVVGTTDKTELSIGFYDPYGDGAHDLSPLRHLYKTQIRELARHLGVPPAIIAKPSSGDLAAGLPNETALGLSYEQLDGILWGLEHVRGARELAAGLGLSIKTIKAVQKSMRAARVREALPSHL